MTEEYIFKEYFRVNLEKEKRKRQKGSIEKTRFSTRVARGHRSAQSYDPKTINSRCVVSTKGCPILIPLGVFISLGLRSFCLFVVLILAGRQDRPPTLTIVNPRFEEGIRCSEFL